MHNYIDDITVYSDSWDEHVVHLDRVLQALRDYGFTAKPENCQWGLTHLGHFVGEGKVSVPEAKIDAIKNFRQPKLMSSPF